MTLRNNLNRLDYIVLGLFVLVAILALLSVLYWNPIILLISCVALLFIVFFTLLFMLRSNQLVTVEQKESISELVDGEISLMTHHAKRSIVKTENSILKLQFDVAFIKNQLQKGADFRYLDENMAGTSESDDLVKEVAPSLYFSLISSNQLDHQNTQYMVVKPVFGLGNRLRVLASAIVTAAYLNRELLVYWSPSEGFDDSEIKDLFYFEDHCLNLIEQQDWLYLRNQSLKIDDFEKIEISSDAKHTNELDQEEALELISKNKVISYQGYRDITHFLHIISSKVVNNYDQKVSAIFQKIKPSPIIQKDIQKSVAFKPSQFYGLHIRQGDAFESPLAQHYKKSSLSKFSDLIANILEKDPKAGFLLSTDTSGVLNQLLQVFPDNIFYYDKTFVPSRWRALKRGQKEAAIEMFLLSRCKMIYGTNWSTFSLIASKMGKIPIEIIE